MRVQTTGFSRRRLFAAALSGAAAALVACGPLPVPGADQSTPAAKPAASTAGGATVRLMTHFNRDGKTPRELALKEITDRFEAEHAGIKVSFEVIPWPDI